MLRRGHQREVRETQADDLPSPFTPSPPTLLPADAYLIYSSDMTSSSVARTLHHLNEQQRKRSSFPTQRPTRASPLDSRLSADLPTSSHLAPQLRTSSLTLPRTPSPRRNSYILDDDDDNLGDDKFGLLIDDELNGRPSATDAPPFPRDMRYMAQLSTLATLHSMSRAMLASDVPVYITARSANSVISESRPTRIQAETLSFLNRILDELLLFIVASSKSLATDRIKTDGLLKVLNNNSLAKDAVLEAELELRTYMQGRKAEGGRVPLGLSATSRWDGTEAFPVSRAYEAVSTSISKNIPA